MPHKDIEKRRRCNRQYWKSNPERLKLHKHKLYLKNRQWLENYKSTLKCSLCEENHPACLDFHHIEPSEKSGRVSNLVNFSIKRMQEEISKCIVLCANCHRKKHAEERVGND